MTEALRWTVTDLLEHAFCPRFTYYEQVLRVPEYQGNRTKVQRGRAVHQRKERENRGYRRVTLGVVEKREDVTVSSERLGVWGRIDEVLFLEDGTVAGLDYKWSPKEEPLRDYVVLQASMYGILLRETFGKPVKRAYLVFLRAPKGIVELPLDEARFAAVEAAVEDMKSVIRTECLPRPTLEVGRCADCCYRNICPR